jgi:glucose dehydrogenase
MGERSGWESTAMQRKLSRDQFSVGRYEVRHTPTGAKFGAYPGEARIGYINWGRVEDDDAAFDRSELQRIAQELLCEREEV